MFSLHLNCTNNPRDGNGRLFIRFNAHAKKKDLRRIAHPNMKDYKNISFLVMMLVFVSCIMVILGITITTYNLQYAFLYTCFLLLLLNKIVVTLQSICNSFELSTFIFKSLIYCSMAKCFSNIFHLGLKRKCHVSSSQVKWRRRR